MKFKPRMAANRASKITPKIKKVLLSDRSLRAKWEIIEAELTLGSIPDEEAEQPRAQQ